MKSLFTLRSAASVFIISGSIFMSSKSFAQALSGTYTINQSLATAGNNFNSFNDAIAQLNTYGVAGAVTFNVDSAVYTTQVIIPEIAGVSNINNITFNGNGATLKYFSSNTNERAVLKLNGADFVIINGFRINAGDTATAQYGYGVQLINNADHNIIRNCTIAVPFVYSPSVVTNYAGLLINSSATSLVTQGNADCDDNRIENNIISGGYHGIALVANGSVNMMNDNKVLNNTIRDFYNAGIYLDGNNNTLVNANDISRPNRATSALFYGIQLNNTSYNTIVSNNKIHDPFGGTAAYVTSGANGIYLANVNTSAENRNLCFNNIIYNFKAGSIIRGIWISGSPFNQFEHNTLSLDDNEYVGFTATTGFEITGSTNLIIQNNVVSIKRVGSSFVTRYGINISPTTECLFSNNDIFLADGSTYYFGKYGSVNCADAAQWALNTGDNTSISSEPGFVAAPNGDLTPTNLMLASGVATSVVTDILGLGRNTVPTMGAFEINGTPLAIQMSTLKVQRNAMNVPVLLWECYSEQNNAGFEIQRSNDAKNWTAIAFVNSKGATANGYTYNDALMTEARIYYRLKQVDIDGSSHFSNVVWLSNDAAKNEVVSIYPNPAENSIHLNFLNEENNIENGLYIISDVSGKVVKTGYFLKNDASIAIGDLTNGIYSIRVNAANKTYYSKFTKQ